MRLGLCYLDDFTAFQLRCKSRGPSAIAELLVVIAWCYYVIASVLHYVRCLLTDGLHVRADVWIRTYPALYRHTVAYSKDNIVFGVGLRCATAVPTVLRW